MNDILSLILLVLFASTIQAATGFGFSIMATPFLLLILGSRDAIQLNIIISFFISLIMIYKIHNEVNKQSLKQLIKGSLIGIFPGILVFLFLEVRILKLGVSILIMASTIFLLFKYKIKQTPTKELITGALSGFLTSSLGMPGPPLLIYFAGAKMDKAALRSTATAYFIFIYLISLLLQYSMTNISTEVWILTLYNLPFTLFGFYLGQKLFSKLNQQLFEKSIYVLLLFTGLYLLFNTL